MDLPIYGFSKDKRLLTAAEFSTVFERPIRSSDLFFTVLALPVNQKTHARLGLAIAKKNLKRAHDRNLVKRIIRESFRINQSNLKGMDIVVMVKPKVDISDRNALHQALKHHWKRIIKRCAPC